MIAEVDCKNFIEQPLTHKKHSAKLPWGDKDHPFSINLTDSYWCKLLEVLREAEVATAVNALLIRLRSPIKMRLS